MIANPVLQKELLTRLRLGQQSKRQRLGIGLIIVLLLGFVYFQTIMSLQKAHDTSDGYALWGAVMGLQCAFILLITPIAAANAITKEREQRTWEMLVFTQLTPSEIILGKLAGRLVSTAIVVLLGLPISLIAMYYADLRGPGSADYISAGRFFGVYLAQFIMGLFFTTVGLNLSLVLKRTLNAVMASYSIIIGGLVIVTTIITGMLTGLLNGGGEFMSKCPLMWFNPVMLSGWLLTPDRGISSDSYTSLYLLYGLIGYALLTALMIWRMIANFRHHAYEA